MTEPRTRTAAEIADHAASIVTEAQELSESMRCHGYAAEPATIGEVRKTLGFVERLAAQVEDLAACVDALAVAPDAGGAVS